MPLSIRAANADDAAQVTGLWRACQLVTTYNDPASDFRMARNKPNSDVLVGLDGAEGLLCGSVMVGHDGHRGWLYYVAALPTLRGQGVGRQMVEAGERWLRQKGMGKVQLLVRETNTSIVSFYEHLDYEQAPRVVMAKWLR